MSNRSILFAFLGNWPTLPTDLGHSPFKLTLEEVDEEWRADLIQQAWDLQVINKAQAKQMRSSGQVIWVEKQHEGTGQNWTDFQRSTHEAQAILELYVQTFPEASCLYFDGACKFLFPDLLSSLERDDPITLLHLFIEIWGTAEEVGTEGMELFNLPNLRIRGVHPKSPAAQATAFSAVAQMICEELSLSDASRFQASESFPWFKSTGLHKVALLDEVEEDQEGEEWGEWALVLHKEAD